LEPGGSFVFITSNKWYRAAYGENIRRWIGRTARIRSIIDFGDADVFDAIAYPTIIVATKRPQVLAAPDPKDVLLAWNWPSDMGRKEIPEFPELFRSHAFQVPQKSLDDKKGWQLEPQIKRDLLGRIRKAGKPLGEYVDGRFYRGILTGLNDAFVIDGETKDRLIAEDPNSAEIIKPFLRGKDVKRWRVEPQDLWLIFTRRGIEIEAFPAIHNHLSTYRDRLEPKPADWDEDEKWEGRKAGSYEWFEIQDNIAYWESFEREKIIIPAIQGRPEAARDLKDFYCNNKASIFVHEKAAFIAGIVNSAVSEWFAAQTFATKQGGFFDFEPRYSGTFPIPDANIDQQSTISAVVPIIEADRDPRFEQLLNGLVYELFFPDELHARNIALFDACDRAGLGQLEGLEVDALKERAEALAREIFAPSHEIASMLNALRSIDVVRIIEGEE
jgi:adenine-specific DNA-methyltransferase